MTTAYFLGIPTERRERRRVAHRRIPWDVRAYRLDFRARQPKPQAAVEDWWTIGGPGEVTWRLCGTVVDHPFIETGDRHLRTSQIIKLDREAGICETRNTVYRLVGLERVVGAEERKDAAWRIAWDAGALSAAAGRVLKVEELSGLIEAVVEADERTRPAADADPIHGAGEEPEQ